MKKSLLILAAAALWTAGAVQSQAAGDPIPDQYIISVAPGVDPAALAVNHGLAPKFVYRTAVNGLAGFVPPGRLRALQNDPRVMGVTPDRSVSIGGKPSGGGGGTTQVVPLGIQRIGAAPGTVSFTGAGVGVAIVDTGLDFNHNDLKPLGSTSYSAVSASAQDDNGHGTHVGGTVAARNNTIDVVGVAPGATLYAVKVLDAAGSGSDATVIAGLDWIAQIANTVSPPIRVLNMSLGRDGSLGDNAALRQAVQTVYGAGISIVVSAGNTCSVEVSNKVPATYPEVLAIASITASDGAKNKSGQFIPKDTASYFTTDGAYDSLTKIGVTISAPGEDKENVNNGGLISSVGILSTRLGGGTTRLSGTSMAAPHVTGVVALLYEQAGGTLAPETARAKLITDANNPNAPLNSPTACYSFDDDREGVVNAPAALTTP